MSPLINVLIVRSEALPESAVRIHKLKRLLQRKFVLQHIVRGFTTCRNVSIRRLPPTGIRASHGKLPFNPEFGNISANLSLEPYLSQRLRVSGNRQARGLLRITSRRPDRRSRGKYPYRRADSIRDRRPTAFYRMGIHPQLANVDLAVYGDLAVGRDVILNNPPVRCSEEISSIFCRK